MLLRVFIFLLFLALGATLGWWHSGMPGVLPAVLAAALSWFVMDVWRALRAIAWFRTCDIQAPPRMVGFWGEAIDRTRRRLRQMARGQKDAQDQLHQVLTALQASPNGVVLLDEQGHIEWCNQMAAEHFGFDLERDRMQAIGNLVRAPEFANYLATKDFSRDVVLIRPATRATSQMKLSVQMFPYEAGRKLLLSRDVTAIELADAMRRDFVANVSHEIRTPLTVMMGFIETIQTLPLDDEERARYLDLMSKQAQRMQSLVADLLTLSRLEGNPPPSLTEWVDAGSLLQRCAEDARALSEVIAKPDEKPHVLRFPSAEELAAAGELAGAGNELQSAMTNLVSNAVRYTPAGGEIVVSYERLPDGRACFKVTDSGPGIAPEHIPRLTERFYRVDRSRSRDTGGTGLGLAIVKHVLQRHGATLQINSTLGRGSEFSVYFPTIRVRAPA